MHSTELLQAWWRLSSLSGMGTVGLNRIRQQLSHPKDLIQCQPSDLVALGLNEEQAKRWYEDTCLLQGFEVLDKWQTQNPQHQGLLVAGIEPYPQALASLKDAPIFLFYRGNLSALQKPMVAMVGSRNPTSYAQEWAQQTAAELASCGVTVVSGMALGIDGFAHLGALDAGGSTIAVLGSGADVYYPKRHSQMAVDIQQNGLIVSEFLPNTAPLARHFPARNRIVSGLSQACVVVEAAQKSGSLITAKLAAEQGRDVFALPGAITNPLTAGPHQLIRDGALLVRDAQDILDELGFAAAIKTGAANNAQDETPELLKHIDFAATDVDTIHRRSNMDVSELIPQLLELEMAGWISMSANGYMRVR